MVDQVSSRTLPAGAIAAPARVAAPSKVATSTQPQVETAKAAPSLARQLAANAPVDAERVQRIKDAIKEGRFPLSPATVADSLIAMKYEWMRHDEA